MHPQDCARRVANRERVVADSRAVRRADLAETRAGLRHDIRHAEAAANLHQLAARDQHLSSARQCRQHQQRRSGAVVDDDRRFGARDVAQQPFGVHVPSPSLAFGEVVLEVGVSGAERANPFQRRRGQRRASEIRVNDDAGGVDHGAQRLAAERGQPGRGIGLEARRRGLSGRGTSRAGGDLVAKSGRSQPKGLERGDPAEAISQIEHGHALS